MEISPQSPHQPSPIANFRGALGFLTIFGGSAAPTASTMAWFPIVGSLIGAVLGGIWWASSQYWPPLVAATLVVVANLIITGALHHDGLADSADGLLPHLSREKRLAIMRQPDIGSFGVLALVATFALQVASLGATPVNIALMAAITTASRTMMVAVATTVPYVRQSGLASSFLGKKSRLSVLYGLGLALLLAGLSAGVAGLISVAATVVASLGVTWLARHRIGGFSGDTLGAGGVIGETGGLLAMGANL